MTSTLLPVVYTCPGEKHPISRAVHLSRMAAYYPKCRDCIHRTETGQLPQQTVQKLSRTQHRVERASLLTDEGVRGIYLNELTKKKAGEIAGALASLLWDEVPLKGAQAAGTRLPAGHKRPGPLVVVGYDERPSSPGVVAGATSVLRRMGCSVVEVGLCTRPCLAFAVDHLQAAAGIFVTGSGRPVPWTGFDFLGRGARPYSMGGGLEALEARMNAGYSRPTRSAGRRRVFQAAVPYQAGLWKHFHALRPLRICCGTPVRMTSALLVRLFKELPCTLQMIDIPNRSRRIDEAQDADVIRVGAAVRRNRAHLGVVIDDDGQRCGFLDENGRLINTNVMGRLIAKHVLAEHAGAVVVADAGHDESRQRLQQTVERAGGQLVDTEPTAGALFDVMREHAAAVGISQSGRFWFRESTPTCDAVLSLARVLQVLSVSDASFSEVADNAA